MNLGTYRGIRVKVNVAFLLLLIVLAFLERLPETLTLFGIVLVHELAHVITARRHGQRVQEIELLPFGGVARIDEPLSVNPAVEKSVAIAGPLANLFLVGVGFIFLTYEVLQPAWVNFFIEANAILGLFNMLPALPLDGGRIYRARLVERIGFGRATERVVSLGKILSIVMIGMGGVGLATGLFNASLVVLGFFTYIAANKEQAMAFFVLFRYLTRKKEEMQENATLRVRQLAVGADARIRDVYNQLVPRHYHMILVIGEAGEMIGIATEADLIDGLLNYGIDTPIRKFARKMVACRGATPDEATNE